MIMKLIPVDSDIDFKHKAEVKAAFTDDMTFEVISPEEYAGDFVCRSYLVSIGVKRVYIGFKNGTRWCRISLSGDVNYHS
jgi:hypothetical protein